MISWLKYTLAAIVVLLNVGRPTTIARLVVAVVVDAVQRVARTGRAFTQLLEELFERGISEFDPSTSVVVPELRAGVRTAMLGLVVGLVLGGPVHPVLLTSGTQSSSSFAPKATTGLREAGRQYGCAHLLLDRTVTTAPPLDRLPLYRLA